MIVASILLLYAFRRRLARTGAMAQLPACTKRCPGAVEFLSVDTDFPSVAP